MSTHFNIQIAIQKVASVVQQATTSSYSRSVAPEPKAERHTTEVLKLAVTADSEAEAFRKAQRILAANAPEPVVEQHLHRASCDGTRRELLCGYPPGPGISG